jgi:uncharacterized protein (DUF58 family)
VTPAQRARWFLLALILVGLLGWIVGGSVTFARLTYFSLVLMGGAYLWSLLSMRGIHLTRLARILRASVGDLFEERFEIVNSVRQSCAWLEIEDQSALPLAEGSRLLTRIAGRQKRSYTARTWLTRRGAFPLGPTVLTSGDPFRLFTLQMRSLAQDELVVLPMTVSISAFPVPPGLLPGGKAIRQKTMDVTPHAAGVREYVPGDPMKRIHWPTSAHRQRLMVKEFEQDPQAEIWLLLDAQRAIHSALPQGEMQPMGDFWWMQRRVRIKLPDDSFEYSVSAAASLARHFLADRRVVGMACAAGKFTVVPAERGERQIGKIMETLAFLQAEGDMPLLGLVTMQAKLIPIGSGVILITTSLQSDLLLAIENLQRWSLRPVVVLLKSESFGGFEGDAAIVEALFNRNIPLCQINCGDDLASALAQPAAYFQRFPVPNPAAYVV